MEAQDAIEISNRIGADFIFNKDLKLWTLFYQNAQMFVVPDELKQIEPLQFEMYLAQMVMAFAQMDGDEREARRPILH